jgi:hypothetical protein
MVIAIKRFLALYFSTNYFWKRNLLSMYMQVEPFLTQNLALLIFKNLKRYSIGISFQFGLNSTLCSKLIQMKTFFWNGIFYACNTLLWSVYFQPYFGKINMRLNSNNDPCNHQSLFPSLSIPYSFQIFCKLANLKQMDQHLWSFIYCLCPYSFGQGVSRTCMILARFRHIPLPLSLF